MPVVISLLRGINVGGNRQIKMEVLRELYESLGLKPVRTFIQSGNVVCKARSGDPGRLTKRIEDAIEEKFGFRVDVILRTAPELREAIAGNPFAGREGVDPARLLITFLAADPDPEGCKKALALDIAPEELRIAGRHVYAYFPDGIARTKLSWPQVGKMLKAASTARNLTTVQKLLAMAEQLEASR